MRTNLLPPERRQIEVFGATIKLEFLRQTLGLTALAAVLFFAAAGIQRLRLAGYQHDAASIETKLQENARVRRRIATAARELAQLQRLDEASANARDSGNRVAVEIVKIGNAIPRGVWLETLARTGSDYIVSGGAVGLEAVADTLQSLRAGDSRLAATLVRLDQPQASASSHFTLHVPTEDSIP